MDREVFLSLLALDSHNRGYGANVGGVEETSGIGRATIRPFDPDAQDGWEAAGFYAIAYNWDGQTVISYRGTNFPTDITDPAQVTAILSDVWNGWTLGAGFPTAG